MVALYVGQVTGGGRLSKAKNGTQIFDGKAWKEFFKMKLLKAANPQLLLKRLVWVNFFTCADQTDTGSRRKAGGKHAQH
jgi:hypothetical protein